MKKIRRRHTSEFKREAVALVTEQGYSCAFRSAFRFSRGISRQHRRRHA